MKKTGWAPPSRRGTAGERALADRSPGGVTCLVQGGAAEGCRCGRQLGCPGVHPPLNVAGRASAARGWAPTTASPSPPPSCAAWSGGHVSRPPGALAFTRRRALLGAAWAAAGGSGASSSAPDHVLRCYFCPPTTTFLHTRSSSDEFTIFMAGWLPEPTLHVAAMGAMMQVLESAPDSVRVRLFALRTAVPSLPSTLPSLLSHKLRSPASSSCCPLAWAAPQPCA